MTDPKFQISCFPAGDKSTQWVIRADTFEELVKMKAEIEALFPAQLPLQVTTTPQKTYESANEKLMRQATEEPAVNEARVTKACTKCGELATLRTGISKKTGKPWSAFFCSSDDKTHAEFV